MRGFFICAVFALTACAAQLPQVIPTGELTADIRYDPAAQTVAQADAKARQFCSGHATFMSQRTDYDGFAYRSYHCVRSR